MVLGTFFMHLFFVPGAVAAQSLSHPEIPFDLDRPDSVFELPRRLTEISGLSVVSPKIIAAVQDEQAVIYELNVHSGEIVREIRFGRSGDFEGIELIDSAYYALRSDGVLFRIRILSTGVESDEIDLDLHGKCDAEGLAREPDSLRLWIACKEVSGTGKKNTRAVYVYDTASGTRNREPVLLLSRDNLMETPRTDPVLKKKGDFDRFKPAGLTFQPGTGNMYLISSPDRRLLVLERDGSIRFSHEFSKKQMRQPEGITFAADGTLFISSEGAGGRGSISVYHPGPPGNTQDRDER